MKRPWYPLSPKGEEPGAVTLFDSRPSWHTLRSWAYLGLCGNTVQLKLTRSGGRLGVLEEDARDFEARIAAYHERQRNPPKITVRSCRERARSIKRAREILAEA